MREVLAAKNVMRQSLLESSPPALTSVESLLSFRHVSVSLLATVMSVGALVMSAVALTYVLAR
jgi:hypothetical protein